MTINAASIVIDEFENEWVEICKSHPGLKYSSRQIAIYLRMRHALVESLSVGVLRQETKELLVVMAAARLELHA